MAATGSLHDRPMPCSLHICTLYSYYGVYSIERTPTCPYAWVLSPLNLAPTPGFHPHPTEACLHHRIHTLHIPIGLSIRGAIYTPWGYLYPHGDIYTPVGLLIPLGGLSTCLVCENESPPTPRSSVRDMRTPKTYTCIIAIR